MNKAKQFKIALFLCLGLASCHHKENLQIPETKVVEGTFYVDIYEEGEIEAINSINISSPNIPWRFGNLKISAIVDDGKQLLTVTENGFGKRSEFSDFESRNRGIFGVRAHNVNDKTGKLATIGAVTVDEDIMAITDAGVVIRTHVDEVPVYNRSASGVRVIRISEGNKVAKMTFTDREDDEEEIEAVEGEAVAQEAQTEGAPEAGPEAPKAE